MFTFKGTTMKNTIKNILISICSGFLGAYVFVHVYTGSEDPKSEEKQEISFAKNEVVKRRGMSETGVDFVDASKISTGSVVYIKTISSKSYQRYTWFDMFFDGGGRITERQVSGSGSGVIFSEDGYIVTNNHVIQGADEIQVIYNKRTYVADLVGTDPSTDLALLKIEGDNFPAIKVRTSKELAVGEWVLAVGNPFNLTSTVTAGIVSAKGRKINILEDIFPIESFIQTDAAINPGNSGGALVNQSGELVGINTAILSKTGSYAGYGFAVPSDIVMKVVNDLKKYGEVQKAFMGVEVEEVNEELYDKLDLTTFNGVVVTEVAEGGAAEKAGLEVGDVIVAIDDAKVASHIEFDEQISYYLPGKKVQVAYLRKGKPKVAEAVLTNLDGGTSILKREVFNVESLGADFELVPKIEKQKLGIENGVRIRKIYDSGLMRRLGIAEGFVITDVNNYKIEKVAELTEVLEKIRGRVIIQGVDVTGNQKYYSYYF